MTATATPIPTAPRRRLHRLERAALQGVLMREIVNYSSFWRSSTFSSTVDPTIYLLAFGFGFGSLVSKVAGYDYIDFVGTGIVAKSKRIESFSYWQSGLLTPMFLVAGTFFPLSGLPTWAQVAGNINPLYHCVELVRHAVFGFEGWVDLWHLGFLVAFAFLAWRLAIRFMERKLIL